MKKILLTAALAALALCGCKKGPEAIAQNGFEFTSERPADDTRTGWTGETLEWTAGDAISMAYTVNGQWVGPNLYPSTPLAQGGPTAHFTVPGNFPDGGTGTHHFYALFPAVSETDFSDAPDVVTAIPEIQTPAASSFDPAADLMAGQSDDYRSRPSGTVPLRWTRLAAHGDITLRDLDLASGETVSHIILQAQNGAELTGDIVVDLASPEDYATDGKPRVTVMADNLAVDTQGRLNFWISIFPVTLTELTVTVETDQATYRKVFSGISKTFARNARNILGISMKGATKTTAEKFYEKVTSAPSDWTGDYLIVYEAGKLLLDGDGTKTSHASVEISDSKIPYEAYQAYNIRIDKDGSGYTMKFGDNFLGLNSSSNALDFSTSVSSDGYRWTFSAASDGTVATNMGYSTRTLRYNSSAKMFRCYTSGQQPVQFYKLNGEASGGGGVTPVAANDDSVEGYIEFNPLNYNGNDTDTAGAISEPWSGNIYGFNDTFNL